MIVAVEKYEALKARRFLDRKRAEAEERARKAALVQQS